MKFLDELSCPFWSDADRHGDGQPPTHAQEQAQALDDRIRQLLSGSHDYTWAVRVMDFCNKELPTVSREVRVCSKEARRLQMAQAEAQMLLHQHEARMAQEQHPQAAPAESTSQTDAQTQAHQAQFAKYRICLEMVESGKADMESVRTNFAALNQSLSTLEFDPEEQLPGFSLRWSVAAEMVAKQQKAIDQEAEKQLQAEQRKQQQAQQKQFKQEQREQAKQARADKRATSKQARQDRREDLADSMRSMFCKREPSWETTQRRQERWANTKQFFSTHGLFMIVLLFSLAATLVGIHFSVNVFLTPPLITGLGVMVYCSVFGVIISNRRSKPNLLAQVLFIVLTAGYLLIRAKYVQAFLSANLVLLIFNTEWFLPRYTPRVSRRYLQLLCFVGIGVLFVVGIEMWYFEMVKASYGNAVWFVPLFGIAIYFLLDKLTEFNLRTIGIVVALFLLRTGVILVTLHGGGMAIACYFYMFLVLLGVGIVALCMSSTFL